MTGSGTITSNGTTLMLGRRSFANSQNANGRYKNFTFQNVNIAWTPAQVADLYYRNMLPSGAKQWSFNDVATDQNGENGLSLTGTAYSSIAPFQPRSAV